MKAINDLGEEVKLQTRNAGPDTQYSYYFYGSDMPKSVFAYCVQQYGLGEMVAETSKEDNAQVYLESAQRCEKVCDEEGAFQAYKAAAEKYDSAEAQLRLGLCYAEGKGNEKNMDVSAGRGICRRTVSGCLHGKQKCITASGNVHF